MGFDELKKNIIDKAEKEAEKLVKAAHKEAEDAKRQLELEMEEYENKVNEDLKKTIIQLENREIASAGLEAKKHQLISRKEIIDKVFEKSKNSIDTRLAKKDRKALVEKLLKKVEKEINVGKIYCSKIDAELVPGKKIEQKNMLGGIIAEDKSGEVQIDYSFETLLSDIKDKQIAQVTGLLFK